MKKRNLVVSENHTDRLTEKIPKRAFSFVEEDISFARATEEGKGFEMLAYSGGVIKNHFWFGNVIIDLASMKFPKSKFPVLMQHNIERKLGFSGKPKPENELRINKMTYLSNEEVTKFKEDSSQGFPFEASISIRNPTIIRLGEGVSEVINGRKVKGPDVTIFKDSVYKESSVVVFGADTDTSSRSFSEDDDISEYDVNIISVCDDDNNLSKSKEGESMNLKEFKEKHPDLASEFSDEVKKEGEAKVTALKSEIKNLKVEKQDLEKDKVELSGRVSGLERKDVIRTEKEQKGIADSVVSSKLSHSEIPEHMHIKVKNALNYQEHMKEDTLDITSFEAAIDAEIKGWEEDLQKVGKSTSPIGGNSFSHKKVTGDQTKEEIDKEDDDAVDDMVSLAQRKDTFFDDKGDK